MLFEKIEFNTEREHVTRFKIGNLSILDSCKRFNKKRKSYSFFPTLRKQKSYSHNPDNKHMFYLKINSADNCSFQCLQHWINIIGWFGGDFYIICDKEDLEKQVYQKIHFDNRNIKFIKSIHKPIEHIVKNMSTKFWTKATYAHLTAFYHAKKLGLNSFWNIDADDTMFLIEAPRAAQILKNAQNYAQANNITAFSMDMHTSRTHGKHWSFGITYIDSRVDWFEIFNNEKTPEWMNKYIGKYDWEFNLDWYFTYLRDFKGFKNKTFYVENLHFMHYGDFMLNPISWGISQWKNGKVFYPILKTIFNQDSLAEIPISTESVKVDTLDSEKMSFHYINQYLTFLNNIPEPAQNMWFEESSQKKGAVC